MPKKIVILTTGQPSTNPRMVKEYLSLKEEGYRVKVYYSYWAQWAIQTDDRLFESGQLNREDFTLVGGTPFINKAAYLYSRFKHKISKSLYYFIGVKCDAAIARTASLLCLAARKQKADLYIAHNLGALPAAIAGAKANKAKAAFDAEDFHRGEDKKNSKHWVLTSLIETKYLPETNYVSAASPLIEQEYKTLFKTLSTITINNVFPIAYLQPLPHAMLKNDVFKMFWFSQTIGRKRGIESVIKAMGLLNNRNIQLSLLGNITSETKEYFLELMLQNNVAKNNVHFVAPVQEADIPVIAAKHHVGLALEVPEVLNRELCLTNKIFLYLLAGNAIIFSRTIAQELFLKENKGIGLLFKSGAPVELAQRISFYIDNPVILNEHQLKASAIAAKKLNWEMESELLISKINEVLN